MILPAERPLIYVRSPYTADDPLKVQANVHRARVLGAKIHATGLAWAIVPHNASRGLEHTLTPVEWYAYCLALLRVSKAVWWSGMRSTGCDLEAAEEARLNLRSGTEGSDELVPFLKTVCEAGAQ